MADMVEIKVAIDRLFSDTSVSPATTRDALEEIKEHIEGLLETLPEGDD